MTARNDITGDVIQTKGQSEAYRSGWDRIFGQKQEQPAEQRSEDKQDAQVTKPEPT